MSHSASCLQNFGIVFDDFFLIYKYLIHVFIRGVTTEFVEWFYLKKNLSFSVVTDICSPLELVADLHPVIDFFDTKVWLRWEFTQDVLQRKSLNCLSCWRIRNIYFRDVKVILLIDFIEEDRASLGSMRRNVLTKVQSFLFRLLGLLVTNTWESSVLLELEQADFHLLPTV